MPFKNKNELISHKVFKNNSLCVFVFLVFTVVQNAAHISGTICIKFQRDDLSVV